MACSHMVGHSPWLPSLPAGSRQACVSVHSAHLLTCAGGLNSGSENQSRMSEDWMSINITPTNPSNRSSSDTVSPYHQFGCNGNGELPFPHLVLRVGVSNDISRLPSTSVACLCTTCTAASCEFPGNVAAGLNSYMMSNGQQQQQQAQGSNMRLEDMLNAGSLSSNQSDAVGMRLQSGSLFNQQPLPFDHGTPPSVSPGDVTRTWLSGESVHGSVPSPKCGHSPDGNSSIALFLLCALGPDCCSVCLVMRLALLPLQACR